MESGAVGAKGKLASTLQMFRDLGQSTANLMSGRHGDEDEDPDYLKVGTGLAVLDLLSCHCCSIWEGIAGLVCGTCLNTWERRMQATQCWPPGKSAGLHANVWGCWCTCVRCHRQKDDDSHYLKVGIRCGRRQRH